MNSTDRADKEEDDMVSQVTAATPSLALRPEARQALDNYLLKLSSYLHTALLELRDNLTSEVETKVLSNLEGNDLGQMQKMLSQLGTPEQYAAQLIAQLNTFQT
jgi:hypothetical protein